MTHRHQYDKKGNRLCCTEEAKIYQEAAAAELLTEASREDSCCGHHNHQKTSPGNSSAHAHDHGTGPWLRLFLPAIVSFILLLSGILADHWIKPAGLTGVRRTVWYAIAYIPVGLPVLKEAFQSIIKGTVFSEFFLMSIATIGAYAIGQYPEGVAVMLFYTVGENFQSLAVRRAKKNIQSLLDQRPDVVSIERDNNVIMIKAEEAQPGDIVIVKPGDQLALDGVLVSEKASFNTAALTGESKPDTKVTGDRVLAGMINLNTLAKVRVTAAYGDSKLSRILELVQHATAQKAPTELFIRRFSKVYTPVVVFLAIGICLLPYFFVENYVFSQWLYRALVFLVISCPCALVISIPLGYFGGIGAGSRHGILFKGSNFLDKMSGIQHVVMDKTGTLTEGVFEVQEVHLQTGFETIPVLEMVQALEAGSTHPVADAIHRYLGNMKNSIKVEQIEEIAGHGMRGMAEGKELLVGNFRLLDRSGVPYHMDVSSLVYTTIAIAYDKKFAGYITIADRIKEDAVKAIMDLASLGIKTTMLSGDKNTVVQKVASELGIGNAWGDLLPEDKAAYVSRIRSSEAVAFAGDGVNDAPVVALSDVGIAMGGLGSDATIETADVIIQDDKPSKIPLAVKIGRQTKRIVWQNIAMAFVVKAAVLLLGAGGIATMWEAVFADVGVALLAILNAVRIQRMRF